MGLFATLERPLLLALLLIAVHTAAAAANEHFTNHGGWGGMQSAPSENECRSFIEKALKEQRSQTDSTLADGLEAKDEVEVQEGSSELQNQVDDLETKVNDALTPTSDEEKSEKEEQSEQNISDEDNLTEVTLEESVEVHDDTSTENIVENKSEEVVSEENDSEAAEEDSKEVPPEKESLEENESLETNESVADSAEIVNSEAAGDIKGQEDALESDAGSDDNSVESAETDETKTDEATTDDTKTDEDKTDDTKPDETEIEDTNSEEAELNNTKADETVEAVSEEESNQPSNEDEKPITANNDQDDSQVPSESTEETSKEQFSKDKVTTEINESDETSDVKQEDEDQGGESDHSEENNETLSIETSHDSPDISSEKHLEESESDEPHVTETENSEKKDSDVIKDSDSSEKNEEKSINDKNSEESTQDSEEDSVGTKDEKEIAQGEKDISNEDAEDSPDEEDLLIKMEIPENLRSKNHITDVLRLDSDSLELETKLHKTEEIILKDLKRLYETAIKPLEILYKYRDLSNRHFGDPEIFSKPLILFMGPWSGGKSTIINYLLDNEYKKTALRTGAEPSPAYFNIVMKGDREEILDGTQLAADWTFSGLQKFGQGLLDRLRGLKLNHTLLDKVNIVEIPGILEIRKQVERLFPFNDACQWFIDRADIIFLVYDPSKLDVGPETEAILDQLKGREYQTRIILNKADQVKPEELMRVQGTLIWNISPLMSSTEPPVMYSTSLWSIPYEAGSPTRLLFAQEKAFLRDLREAVDKRVENKIGSARRFAVRVRNHAKMVDCYLTTYYNHKTFFGNRQKVAEDIIEHPQNYHIYEGLSTLTNISRYDLPDPDVYRDFFRLNPVYDFQNLASTCTYFRGCPINRLDVAIAYDLPELVGKYKKMSEDVIKSFNKSKSDIKGKV